MTSNDELNEIFKQHFPEGRIEWIAYSDVPEEAMKPFEGWSRRFILPEDYQSRDFTGLFVVHHSDDMRTYVARQLKVYHNGTLEELTYLVELGEDNTFIGHGELRFQPKEQERDFFKNKPFVGYTGTEKEFQRRGLGIRRLISMNAISQLFFELPLNSSEKFIEIGAEKAWEHLVREGKAKSYQQDKRHPREIRMKLPPVYCTRYVFV